MTKFTDRAGQTFRYSDKYMITVVRSFTSGHNCLHECLRLIDDELKGQRVGTLAIHSELFFSSSLGPKRVA